MHTMSLRNDDLESLDNFIILRKLDRKISTFQFLLFDEQLHHFRRIIIVVDLHFSLLRIIY